MKSYLKLVRYAFEGTDWSTTPEEITDAYDIDVSLSLGDLNDTANFSIPNTNNSRITGFVKEDKITIHLLEGSETYDDTNVIFVGLIKNISEKVNRGTKVLDVDCISIAEVLSTGLVYSSTTNVDVMQYLQHCLDVIKNYDKTFSVKLTWDTALNPTVKKDTTAFPKLNGGGLVSDKDKSFNTIINKFLTEQYLQDGQYYWFVDVDNKLKIRARLNNPVATLIEGTDMISAKYALDPQVFNFIVVKCGFDSETRPITTRAVDYTSIGKNGFKYYMLVDNSIASDLYASDNVEQGGYPTAYPHTCSWKDENGDTVTATSDSDYRTKFRTQCKIAGTNYGLKWINLNSTVGKKFTIELMPTKNFTVGEVVTIYSPSYNLNHVNMRIQDIQYSNSNTVLTLKEDVNI